MSRNVLEEVFEVFMRKFPPVQEYHEGLTLKLSTLEISTMLEEFCPGMDLTGLYDLMLLNGYTFIPIESSESVKFYWILGRS